MACLCLHKWSCLRGRRGENIKVLICARPAQQAAGRRPRGCLGSLLCVSRTMRSYLETPEAAICCSPPGVTGFRNWPRPACTCTHLQPLGKDGGWAVRGLMPAKAMAGDRPSGDFRRSWAGRWPARKKSAGREVGLEAAVARAPPLPAAKGTGCPEARCTAAHEGPAGWPGREAAPPAPGTPQGRRALAPSAAGPEARGGRPLCACGQRAAVRPALSPGPGGFDGSPVGRG